VFQLRPWRWRFGVRIWRSTTYAPSSRTHSGNVHIRLTYVFHRRTYFSGIHIPMTCVSSGDVRIHVRVLPTYECYRRTYATDVRVPSTCVFYPRTCFDDVRIRDYALEIQIRDYAVENRGVGTTQNILDLMKKIAVNSFYQALDRTKITTTLRTIYIWDVH